MPGPHPGGSAMVRETLRRGIFNYKPYDGNYNCKMHWGNSGTKLTGVTNRCLIVFKAPSMRWNPSPTLLRGLRG